MSDIVIKVILDDGAFKKSLGGAEEAASKVGKEIGTSLSQSVEKGVGSAFSGIKTQLLALGATILSGFAFKKIIEEASQAQEVMNDLKGALRLSGQDAESASQRFKEFAEEMQRTTTVTDDAVISGGALLTNLTNLRGEGLEKATKAALDLSAATNKDLNVALDAVAKAANGNTGALAKMGIKVDENLPKSERFAAALQQIQDKLGGSAENKVNTFGGAIAQLGNNFNDILKSLGKAIVESPAVVAAIKFISGKFAELAGFIKTLIGTNFVDTIVKNLVGFAMAINTYVLKPIEFVGNAFLALVTSAQFIFQRLITVVATVGNTIFQSLISPIQKILEVTGKLTSSFNGELSESLTSAADKLKVFGETATDIKDGITQLDNEALQKVKDSFGNLFNFNITDASAKFLEDLKLAMDSAKAVTKEGADDTGNNFAIIAEKIKKLRDDINNLLKNGIVNLISQSMQSIGASLIKGGSAFSNFKGLILNILGDLAIQLGVVFLGYALAIDALQKSLVPPFNPFLALAAGLALIALGGALKAAAAGEGGPTTNPGSGGYGSGGGVPVGGGAGTTPPTTDNGQAQAAIEREQRGTQIAVNIQGNVLDRRQTGLEIADVLNETFGTQGIVVASA